MVDRGINTDKINYIHYKTTHIHTVNKRKKHKISTSLSNLEIRLRLCLDLVKSFK